MRYLLHHTDAVYDATTKRWRFTLERRVANPREIRIQKCVFTAATASTYPSIVYMRSDALHNLSTTKHTIELKGSAHENASNVIAILEETHTLGRYAMKDVGMTMRVHGHHELRSIDVYFTDGNTPLDGTIVAGGGGGGQPAGAADDSTITSLPDLVMWLDFSDLSMCLDSSYTAITGVGDRIQYIQNKNPAPVGLMWSTNVADGLELASFGANTTGVIGYSNWAALSDNSNNNPAMTIPFSFQMLFRTPATAATSPIFKNYCFEFQITGSHEFRYGKYENGTLGYGTIQGSTFLPNTSWYVQCVADDFDGDGTVNYWWEFIRLSDNFTFTESTAGFFDEITPHQNWEMGNASSHFTHTLGHVVITNDNNATSIQTIKTWLLAKYGVADGEEAPPAPVTEDASFFTELQVKTDNR